MPNEEGSDQRGRNLTIWLKRHGFGKYATEMLAHDIGVDVLTRLSDEDLQSIGMSLGDRRRLELCLESDPPDAALAPPSRPANAPERRHLTVMFCDLVGSTSLSASLDPEEYRDILVAYHRAVESPLQKYAGYISRYMGDGLLIYFGYPSAHEDDATRAVRAGLEVLTSLTEHTPRGIDLQVRIGIATGDVVAGDIVGEGASELRAVLGETPNLAARLQGIAEPNTVVIADSTHRLIGSSFETESLGEQDLKGIPNSVEAFRVRRLRTSTSPALAVKQLPPLIGRTEELRALLESWEQLSTHQGKLVLLNGEPGIGKTRLTQELCTRVAQQGHRVRRLQCSPYHGSSPFHPMRARLENEIGAAAPGREPSGQVNRQARLDTLVKRLGHRCDSPNFSAAVLDEFLGFAAPRDAEPMTHERMHAELLNAWVAYLMAPAEQGPALLVIEDAHWIDPSTLDVLTQAIAQLAELPMMLLVTHRPEFVPPWPQECIYRGLALSRLDARDGAALALQIAARVSLAPRMLERIVEKTDGVPLFVEELTKAVLESEQPRWYDDDLPGQTLAIPESLKDSLMARLDRLAAVKEVAQIGACIGREFSYDLLRRVVDMPEQALLSALEKLTQSGLVNQVDTHRATYSFKHALVQDTAYESLLRAHRQALHSRIANALEEHFPHVVATQPEILAHHFMAASAIESAAEYYLAAARLGFARSTNDEAIGQLNKGIALSARLDDPTKARDLELRLQSTKAHVLANSRGYGAAEVRDAYDRARQLSLADDGRTVVAPGQLVLPVLGGLASYYWTRADVPRALEYMIQRRTLADQSADPNFQLVAYGTLATLTAYAGDLATADHFFTSSFAFFKHATRDDLHIEFGTDPHTRNLAWNGWVRTLIGEHDAPLESVHIALDRAVHLKHPATIGQAKAIATLAATMHGDIELAERWGEECIHYGTEQHLVFWGPLGRVGRASAHAAQGRFDLACAEYQALLDVVERIGGMGGHGWLLVLAAEMYLANGQDAHAEHLLDTAQQLLRRSGERVWTSELHRIQGRLAQARGRTAAASESFDAAVAAGAEVGARHLRAKALKDLHLVSPPTPESTESGRVVSA